LDLNPSCSFGHAIVGRCELVAGRVEEGLRSFERAWELDPLSHRSTVEVGVAHFFAGRIGECEHWFKEARDLAPGAPAPRLFLLMLYFVTGRWEEAMREIGPEPPSPHNDFQNGMETAVLARCGRQEEAQVRLRHLRTLSESRYVDPMALATAQLGLDDRDAAMQSLEEAVKVRSPRAAFLRINPLLQPLREESRFQVLLSALHLE
jgi:Flp pilus assembly protein TadD